MHARLVKNKIMKIIGDRGSASARASCVRRKRETSAPRATNYWRNWRTRERERERERERRDFIPSARFPFMFPRACGGNELATIPLARPETRISENQSRLVDARNQFDLFEGEGGRGRMGRDSFERRKA